MKNFDHTQRSLFSRFWHGLFKNLNALFESSEKREFQRLKNFIAS